MTRPESPFRPSVAGPALAPTPHGPSGVNCMLRGRPVNVQYHILAPLPYIPVDIIWVHATCILWVLGFGLGYSCRVGDLGSRLGSRFGFACGFALFYIIDMGSLLSYESHGKRQHI